MEKVYNARNSILGFGLGVFILIVLSDVLNRLFGTMNTIPDKHNELQGQMILSFMRIGPLLAMMFCMHGARLVAQQASLLLAIVSALLLSIAGMVGALLFAVLDGVVFHASMVSTSDRFVWGIVFGGLTGLFWGWLFAVIGRVTEKKTPLTLTQFLLTIPIIDRRTGLLILVSVVMGIYLVVAVLFMVVGYGYLGIMMGIAVAAVIGIILVNKFNSAKSTSGGRNVRQ